MFFRSVSASPTCLYGRVARFSPVLPCRLYICQSCRYSLTLASNNSDKSDADQHDAGSLRRKHAASSNLQHYLKEKDFPPPHDPGLAHQVQHAIGSQKSAAKAVAVADCSAFCEPISTKTLQVAEAVDRDSVTGPHEAAPGSEKVRYAKWEDIHQRFHIVRRERPDETATVFEEEVNLARGFLGHCTSDGIDDIEFRSRWKALSTDEQNKLLPSLLIGSMTVSARSTLVILSNVRRMRNEFQVRMNCLRDIGIMYMSDIADDAVAKQMLDTQIEKMRSPEHWPQVKMATVLLQVLLLWSTPEQCQTIIKDFTRKYPDADPMSIDAIIDHFLRIKDREQAFEYFKLLPRDKLQQPDQNVKKLRNRLLRMDVVVQTDTGANFKYLPQILALGVPPDEELYNAVIESAVMNETPDVAWDLYQYLEGGEFKTNARSILLLLRDSYQRGDLKQVDKLMTIINNRPDLHQDNYLIVYSMNIVRNICSQDKSISPAGALSHIMALYDRVYDRAPLIRLGIVSTIANGKTRPEPTQALLAFTIWTYILVQRRNTNVNRLWEWMKHLIADNDRSVVNVAKLDVVYNGFMLFYGRRASTLHRAMDIMQYMLSSALCKPGQRSWSILLCALLKHGHVEQAEKVLTLMKARGIDLTEFIQGHGSYVPMGYDIQEIANIIDESLDERPIPEVIEELFRGSTSLHGQDQLLADDKLN